MCRPGIDEYRQLKDRGRLVPVYGEFDAGGETPLSALLKVKRGDYAFLLESAEGSRGTAGYSFIGTEPYRVLSTREGDKTNPLDAIAAGQFTPGPLLSTATFVGYVLRGVPGAILATVGVFLPSFIFVAALHRVLPRFRRSAWASAFLDSVNVASLGLMATVTVKLGAATLTDWRALLIALVAAVLALRWKANGAVLVLAGALAGWLLHLAH